MENNIPLFISYVISLLVMIGLPVLLAFLVTRYFKVSWWVVLPGVLTFLLSQAVHYPAVIGINALFNNGVLPIPSEKWVPLVNGVIGGLLAGICEETARLVGFAVISYGYFSVRFPFLRIRFKFPKVTRYGSAFALGIGHGGIESIILAVLGTGATLFTVLFYNAGGEIAKGISTDQVQYMLFQIEQFWTTPWVNGLLPGVERIIAISLQIFLSTLVWKAVVDRSVVWFLLAVLYHAVVDALAVYLAGIGWGYWAIEGILAVFLVLNIYLLYRFWREEKEIEEEMEELEELEEGDLLDDTDDLDDLDDLDDVDDDESGLDEEETDLDINGSSEDDAEDADGILEEDPR